MVVNFSAQTLNTGAATLNVNGLGAKTIKKFGTANDLATGDILANQIVTVIYDGTNFQMTSALDEIVNLTEDTTPDSTADYLKTWDASATTYKKVLIQNAVPAATQANQETATSTITFVTPGRQQYHPSSPKYWVKATYSAGTPSATVSYNVTSLTDTGVGRLTVNFTTVFSSTNHSMAGVGAVDFSGTTASNVMRNTQSADATSSVEMLHNNLAGTATDPVYMTVQGWGDQ
jgi:hypothetical protein